jgi:hypothetical protein
MSEDRPVEQQDFTRAEDLLAVLGPTEQRWKEDLREWVFRGHAELDWKLVPSILRCEGQPEPWKQFLPDSDQIRGSADGSLRDFHRKSAEFAAVLQFMRAADRAGLTIPEDSQSLRSSEILAELVTGVAPEKGAEPLSDGMWPPRDMLSVVALAQHYRIPTRLLDWSRRPRVAAYHAAEGVLFSRDPLKTDRLVVWGLRNAFITWGWWKGNDSQLVTLVTAPQATNPNLAAQAGLFTLVRHRHEDVSLDDLITERIASGEVVKWLKPPALWRLTLPHSEAPRLLRLLALDGVSAATVYPGYAGVARSLEEQRRWDK